MKTVKGIKIVSLRDTSTGLQIPARVQKVIEALEKFPADAVYNPYDTAAKIHKSIDVVNEAGKHPYVKKYHKVVINHKAYFGCRAAIEQLKRK